MSKKSNKVNKVAKKTSSSKKAIKKKPSVKKNNKNKSTKESVSLVDVTNEKNLPNISPKSADTCIFTLTGSSVMTSPMREIDVRFTPEIDVDYSANNAEDSVPAEKTIEQDLADFFKEYSSSMINSLKQLYVAVTSSVYSCYLSVKRFSAKTYTKVKNFLISSDL